MESWPNACMQFSTPDSVTCPTGPRILSSLYLRGGRREVRKSGNQEIRNERCNSSEAMLARNRRVGKEYHSRNFYGANSTCPLLSYPSNLVASVRDRQPCSPNVDRQPFWVIIHKSGFNSDNNHDFLEAFYEVAAFFEGCEAEIRLFSTWYSTPDVLETSSVRTSPQLFSG
ncbi:predicted protein [Botrytis cinerea T4]|uniref:Uncharacterized protein n=1 Tax=Botryotinia fuckeliana (strain T4) TaxID=999810 RepID=G2YX94_BOTF4|nr:predicted protein [Botrytis cinerea T4]